MTRAHTPVAVRLPLLLSTVVLVAAACGASSATLSSPPGAGSGASVPAADLGAPTSDLLTTPQIIAAVAGSVDTLKWPNLADPGDWDGSCVGTKVTGPCWNGDPKGVGTILIVGDSYAGMWRPPIAIRAMETGRKVDYMMLQSCSWPDLPAWSVQLNRAYPECDAFRVSVIQRVKDLHPDVVVLTSGYQAIWMAQDGKPTKVGLDAAWITGENSMIGRIKEAGAGRIIVMGDLAVSPGDPLDCLSAHPDNVPTCNTPRSTAVVTDHNAAEKSAVEKDGATYVDAIPWLCTDQVCPEVIAGITVRKDRWHLSLNYALWLRRALAEAMGL